MTVGGITDYLKQHWPAIREQLPNGTYEPKPVRRVEIPKPDGGVRKLGIPTVLDWRAAPVPPGSDGADPPLLPPSESARSGCRDRCTKHRTGPGARPPRAGLPSPLPSILPPPTARSRSRWWRRPG